MTNSSTSDSTATRTAAAIEWLNVDDTVLPMLPAVAHRVIELVSDQDVSISTNAGLVSKDQVLASRVLGLANSAYCASMQTVSTVLEAIVRLGTHAVRNVVVTVSFTSRMHDPRIYGERGREMSDHALGTAYLARLVAERAGVDVDEAFLCGLLHDIGKLVILKRAHDHARRTGQPLPAADVEQALIQHHATLGGMMMEKWKLPEALIEPVACHHQFQAAETRRREAAVAYAANLLAHRYGFGCSVTPREDFLADPVAEYLKLDDTWLDATDVHAPGLFEVARQILT